MWAQDQGNHVSDMCKGVQVRVQLGLHFAGEAIDSLIATPEAVSAFDSYCWDQECEFSLHLSCLPAETVLRFCVQHWVEQEWQSVAWVNCTLVDQNNRLRQGPHTLPLWPGSPHADFIGSMLHSTGALLPPHLTVGRASRDSPNHRAASVGLACSIRQAACS